MIPLPSAGDEKFVMVERKLTPRDQGQRFRDFEKLEVERMGAGTHERLHTSVDG
jgi:hypothetical protein